MSLLDTSRNFFNQPLPIIIILLGFATFTGEKSDLFDHDMTRQVRQQKIASTHPANDEPEEQGDLGYKLFIPTKNGKHLSITKELKNA